MNSKVGEHAVGNPDEAARGFENILRADDERKPSGESWEAGDGGAEP